MSENRRTGLMDVNFTDAIFSENECAAYHWNIQTDTMMWSSGLYHMVEPDIADKMGTGKGFMSFFDRDNIIDRYSNIISNRKPNTSNDKEGYQFFYRIIVDHEGKKRWVEDIGHSRTNDHGRVVEARGILNFADQRMEMEEKHYQLIKYDQLTGIYNRAYFLSILESVIHNCLANRKNSVFITLSINNLRRINENFGLDMGDEIIARVAKILLSKLRKGDSIGRLSGNKIGIILSDCDMQQSKVAAERLTQSVHETIFETRFGPMSATVSAGAVVIPTQARQPDMILYLAHEALNQCKKDGIHSYHLYQPNLEQQQARRNNRALSDDLVKALNERRFILGFQPVVDIKSRKTVFKEALLRLIDQDGALMTAGRFIPMAEKLSLIRLLDQRALELTLDTLVDNPDITLSLNVSNQTLEQPNWTDYLKAFLVNHPDCAGRLIVEITESAAMHDLEHTERFLEFIKALGAQVAIDDFGAGYTSFAHLKNMKVDIIKIDGFFIKNLCTDPKDQVFVQSLVNLARTFSAKTVAEWVGQEDTAELLKELGVDYIQGELTGLASLESGEDNLHKYETHQAINLL
jgi:diguanylate cyclase (GGDEF)-like protein